MKIKLYPVQNPNFATIFVPLVVFNELGWEEGETLNLDVTIDGKGLLVTKDEKL